MVSARSPSSPPPSAPTERRLLTQDGTEERKQIFFLRGLGISESDLHWILVDYQSVSRVNAVNEQSLVN